MTISVVQSKVVSDALTGSFSTATTAGNTIVVAVPNNSASNVTMTVTGVTLGGSAGNFAQAAAVQSGFADGFKMFDAIWVDPDCAGGQTAITVTGTNLGGITNDNGIAIMEIAGLVSSASLSDVLDKTATSSGTTGTAVSTGTTAATTQANEIAIAVITAFNTITGPTSGWTTSPFNDGNGEFCALAYKILSATGTQSFGATQGASDPWAGAVVTLKAASAPPPSGNRGAFFAFFAGGTG